MSFTAYLRSWLRRTRARQAYNLPVRLELMIEPLEARELRAAGPANQLWGAWVPGISWVDVHVADVTGDGTADLVGRAADTGEWWVARSTGSAFVNVKWGQWVPSIKWLDVQVADVNGDGKADLVGRAADSGDWWAALSTGSGFVNQK